MRIYIGLISSSVELINEFSSTKEALIPKSIKDKLPKSCEFKFDAFNPNKSKGNFSVDKHLLEASRGYEYALCLIDNDLTYLCGNLRRAILSATIDPTEVVNGKTHNFFSTRLNKIFKAAIFTINQMSNSEVEHAMRLPSRNFDSAELRDLCLLYENNIMEAEFHNLVKKQIVAVLKRRQPRRESSFQTKYFIDERRKHFVFGKEHHEVLPTGEPHQPHCELNGNFRFGRRISIDRHFNVSRGDGDDNFINGEFTNCHDEIITPSKNRTHLNMFSNDHC